MFFTQFHNRVFFSARIDQNGEIVMMSCRRCEGKDFECKLFSLSSKCIRLSRAKLRRLQKKFLQDREKKLFDKDLSDVEEFERLKKFEKVNEVQRAAEAAFFVNDFLTSEVFFFGSLS